MSDMPQNDASCNEAAREQPAQTANVLDERVQALPVLLESPERYSVTSSHIIIPRSDIVSRTYCGRFEFVNGFDVSQDVPCVACFGADMIPEIEKDHKNHLCNRCTQPFPCVGECTQYCRKCTDDKAAITRTESVPLRADDVKFIGNTQNFDVETYRTLFLEYQTKVISLNISSPKALVEMNDEELLAWVHQMDDFVRLAKVAATSSRVRLEDRKLQLTLEQRQAIEKLDRQYKPKTIKEPKEKKEPKEAKDAWANTPELKRVAATMKILGMTREEAETWIADQKK